MLMKICGKCGKKIRINEICNCTKERHKVYDREYRNKDNAEFYHSKAWKSMTALCKLKANGLDLYELVINNNIVKGTLSHHIDELEEARDKALDINNLIWISDKTHAYIHSEYNKNLESKNKMKEVLFNIIKNYYK